MLREFLFENRVKKFKDTLLVSTASENISMSHFLCWDAKCRMPAMCKPFLPLLVSALGLFGDQCKQGNG